MIFFLYVGCGIGRLAHLPQGIICQDADIDVISITFSYLFVVFSGLAGVSNSRYETLFPIFFLDRSYLFA